MSVRVEAGGRRAAHVDVEVPGTAEQVWQAVATGPGVSCWFVPTDIEERVGGAIVAHFGPGMDSSATITAWEPGRRFAAAGEIGPGAPPLTTEWSVTPGTAGKCVVRVEHSLIASTKKWDSQLEAVETGWPAFFRILQLYLEHFAGLRCAHFQVMGFAAGSESQAWHRFKAELASDAPPFRGVVEVARTGQYPYALYRLDLPAPGAAFLNACAMGDRTYLGITFYLYGDTAAQAAAEAEPAWQAWMQLRFPA